MENGDGVQEEEKILTGCFPLKFLPGMDLKVQEIFYF